MLISLTTFLATLSSIFRSRAALQLENLALRHQIGVLRRSARKRPKLTSGDLSLANCYFARDRFRRGPEPSTVFPDSTDPKSFLQVLNTLGARVAIAALQRDVRV